MLLAGRLVDASAADQRAKPLLIGALTESWGPTPAIVGLRDGLSELGYRENEQLDRKSTRLNSSHIQKSRMPSSA